MMSNQHALHVGGFLSSSSLPFKLEHMNGHWCLSILRNIASKCLVNANPYPNSSSSTNQSKPPWDTSSVADMIFVLVLHQSVRTSNTYSDCDLSASPDTNPNPRRNYNNSTCNNHNPHPDSKPKTVPKLNYYANPKRDVEHVICIIMPYHSVGSKF